MEYGNWYVVAVCIILIVDQHCMETITTKTLPLSKPVELKLSKNTSINYCQIVFEMQPQRQYSFVIPQLHTQYQSVVSSKTSVSTYGFEYNATNTGIVDLSITINPPMFYVGSVSNNSVDTLVYGIPYVPNSPIPGACCLTCAMEIDPNIRISYDSIKTHLQFARASKYWDFSKEIPQCDEAEPSVTFELTYDIYYYYTEEGDLSLKGLFDALWKMSTPKNIKENGQHLVTITGSTPLHLVTETVFAQGVIFNVIVTDDSVGIPSAYVPVSTYACNFTSINQECSSLGSKTSMAYCIIFAVVGIVMCFAGFKLLRVLIFLSGVVVYWLLFYIILARYAIEGNSMEVMVISSTCSLIGGGFILFMYAFRRFVYIVLLNISAAYGLFVSAILFYTPFGYMEIWNVDYRFSLGLICSTLLIIAVFMFYPKNICYLFSSLLGSYAFIMLPNYFLRTNLQYIVITPLLRLTVSDFGSSYLRRPYQKNDYILTGAWAALFLIGLIVQYFTTKNETFIVSGRDMRKKIWQKFSESVLVRKGGRSKQPKQEFYVPPNNERTPLLSGNTQKPSDDISPFSNQQNSSNLSSFRPGPSSASTLPEEDLLHHSRSRESKEYQPLLHQPNNYGGVSSAPPPPYTEERYPKII